MINRFFTCLIFSFSLLNSESPRHLEKLLLLEEEVLPENASYIHGHGTVTWKEENGEDYVCHADCSGLLSAVLRHCYGYTHQELKEWIGGEPRPKAKNYFDAIMAENRFKRVTHIQDLLPGDILAVKDLTGAKNRSHVMVAVGIAEERKSTAPLIENSRQWTITIIDSTTSPHGKQDTRHQPDNKFRQGIGKGIFRVYTDLSEHIIGFTWSESSSSVYHNVSTRPIVVGRLH